MDEDYEEIEKLYKTYQSERVLLTDEMRKQREEEILAKGGRALAVPTDVTDEEEVEGMMAASTEALGPTDILVNNAGVMLLSPLEQVRVEDWDRMVDVNLKGVLYGIAAVLPGMIERGSGHIVNVGSTAGLKGGQRLTTYSATKFALRGMTECWRDELRRHDVRVMLVNPSEVLTDFGSKAGFQQEQSAKKLRGQEIADAIVGALKIDDRGFIPEFSVFATNPF